MAVSDTLRLSQRGAVGIAVMQVTTMPEDLSALPATAGSITLNIGIGGTATGWALTEMSDFIVPSIVRGAGNGTLRLNYETNTSNQSRSAEIVIQTTGGEAMAATHRLNLVQGPSRMTATLSVTTDPENMNMLPATGGSVRISIDIGGSATGWRIANMPPFFNAQTSDGDSDDVINLSYAANDTRQTRTGEIVFVTVGGMGMPRVALSLTQLADQATLFGTQEDVFSSVYVVNPASQDLLISGLKTNTELEMYTLSGNTVLTSKLRAGNQRIPLRGVSTGVYILVLVSENGEVHRMRLIKE